MKRASVFLNWVLFLIIFGCSSVSNKKNSAIPQLLVESQMARLGKPAIIAGKIVHKEVYPQTKEIKLIMPDFAGNETILYTEINEKGEFRFEFFPMTRREIQLLPIENILVISPGDSLFLIKDFKDIANVTFSGDGSSLNTQISKFSKYFLDGFNSDYLMTYNDYKQYCNIEKERYFQKLIELQKDQELSNDFKNWISAKIKLEYSNSLMNYRYRHFNRTKEQFSDSIRYYSFVDDIPNLFNNYIVLVENFQVSNQLLLQNAISSKNKPFGVIDNKDTTTYNLFINSLIMKTDTSYSSQFLLANLLSQCLNSNSPWFVDQNWIEITKKISDPFLMQNIIDHYMKVMENNKNPQKVSNALLGKSNDIESGKPITIDKSHKQNPLNKIIESNPNKVIYIDLWSSWCQPCLSSMSYSNLLMKDFANMDVEFVFMNVLDKEENWRKAIKKLGIGGKHYFLNESETRDILNPFNCDGVPFYILINKKGVIVEYGFHLVPSSTWTKQKIIRLIAE